MLEKIKGYIDLLRPHQWYKNIILFIPLLLTSNLLNIDFFISVTIGFVLFCIISGCIYIINDIIDYDVDLLNIHKKNRPLVSGIISLREATVFLCILLSIDIAIGIFTNYLLILIAIVLNSVLYTIYFKKEIIMDNVSLSLNYVFRIIAGYVIVEFMFDYYVVMIIFFFAMLMSIGKRTAESILLQKNKTRIRKTLSLFTNLTIPLMIGILSSLFLITLTIYLINSLYGMIAIPVIVFLTLRYLLLLESDPIKVMSPNTLFKDKIFIIGFLFVCFIITLKYIDYMVFIEWIKNLV